ncbi:MAG TPA: ADP-ribosylglycohydrolase family protein [Actinomycetota bacterium]|nr:ADP-ribosylglycohydrolase family protein [Actinomycetota bacterium]
MDSADRVAGSVLGLALGDALGAPFEGRRADEIPEPLPALETPWMGLPPGSTTDDTAMARNLVGSLAARGEFDSGDLMARHLEWFRSDPPDVGAFTRRVLSRVDRGEDAFEAARAVWEERGPEVSAGNGSVMYCAPLGLAYSNRAEQLLEVAPKLSALTHFDERCRTAVLAVTLAVAALTRGQSPEGAVTAALVAVIDREGGEELEYLVEMAGVGRRIDGPDRGFCLFTAGVGLQSLLGTGDFEAEVRRVVSLGGDTDTNAAVAGALLGALVGETGLPHAWLDRLQERTAIRTEALALVTPGRRSRRSPEA